MRCPRIVRSGLALVLLLGLPWTAPVEAQETPGQEVIPHAQDRPPNPPRSPEEAIAAMTVPPGFSVELVAGEPDLVNPVAMTFDERGRIWVTESLEYPRREPGPGAKGLEPDPQLEHRAAVDQADEAAQDAERDGDRQVAQRDAGAGRDHRPLRPPRRICPSRVAA